MAVNPMGKSRKADAPYLIVEDMGGTWVTKVLKAYSGDPDAPFARWFCTVATPYTFGGSDMGDTYIADVRGTVTYRDPSIPDSALPAHLR